MDWLAHNLPVEGERAEPPTAGRLARDDAVLVAPDDRVGAVLSAIEASPYPFALVSSANRMLLGRVRASELNDAAGGQAVGEVMELDPSTVRPHRGAGELAEQLAEQDLRWAIVTTPEGRLIGVAWREDLERAAAHDA